MLRGLYSNAEPGVLYAIYLDLPANATPAQSADHLVGTINFFDAVAQPGHESASVDKTRFISFDATEIVRAAREEAADRNARGDDRADRTTRGGSEAGGGGDFAGRTVGEAKRAPLALETGDDRPASTLQDEASGDCGRRRPGVAVYCSTRSMRAIEGFEPSAALPTGCSVSWTGSVSFFAVRRFWITSETSKLSN